MEELAWLTCGHEWGFLGPRVSLRTEGPSKVHESSGLTMGDGAGIVTIIVNSKELRNTDPETRAY